MLKDITIPTNPEYDWKTDPTEQAEYVNPVTLNNRVIQLANAAIVVTGTIVAVNRRIAKLKAEVSDAEFALEDFEKDLLLKRPAPSSATKSTKLLNAYLQQVAFEEALETQFKALISTVRSKRRALQLLDAESDNAHAVYQVIKLNGEHIQTHLSFVKQEARQLRGQP